MEILKGDLVLIDNQDTVSWDKERPWVVLQNNIANKFMDTVAIAPLTSNVNRILPTHALVETIVKGIHRDSKIVVEKMRVIDRRLIVKNVGRITDEQIILVDRSISIFFDIHSFKVTQDEEKEYEEGLREEIKPLVITEGKTDVNLINCAWGKLYPDKEMPFRCQASGIEIDENEKIGSADHVRRALEYYSTIETNKVIGLFDNDHEGNKQFQGLNKKIFETYRIQSDLRKHLAKSVWGLLLPVTEQRKIFVTKDDSFQRYFVIEHYFSDEVLKNHSMYGQNILGTSVFKVNNKKEKFSKEVMELDAKEFEGFKILFNKIIEILEIK